MRYPCVVVVTLLLASGLGMAPAHADAVPPAPENCPPGKVGVTSHSGPECVDEAPDNCAPGYRGQIGGRCVLAVCGDDSGCFADERCMQVDTCQEFRELHWTGWGWSAQRPVSAGNLLAEPPSPQPPGPPKKAWVQLNICHQDGACAAPAKCRPTSLCYPTSEVGKTKAKVRAPGSESKDASDPAPSPTSTSAGPSTDNDPPGDVDVVVDPGGYKPPESSGGCRQGCTAAAPAPEDTMLGVGLWLLAIAAVRRGIRR